MRHKYDQFEEIYKLIKNIDMDDAIIKTMKLKEILKYFTNSITDEKLLSDVFDFLNTRALKDETYIEKLVSVVSSRQMESFIIKGKIVRHAMLEILQKNFQSADHLKHDDMKKFYNSVKLLGEYFNKARISNGNPINIIGQSLLNLLNQEVEKEVKVTCHFKHDNFSELVLTQIALNGPLLKTRHKTEIELLLLNIRKCLIEIDSLSSKNKAYLIMTIDLYYSNFNGKTLGNSLDKMYETYLFDKNITETKQPQKCEEVKKLVKSHDNGYSEKVQESTSRQKKHSMENDRKSEVIRNPSSSNHKPVLRKSEPIQHQSSVSNGHIQNQKSPQRRISPKELRTRNSRTPPKLEKSSSQSPKSFRVESAIDKLQIKSSNDSKQNSSSSDETAPCQSSNDENVLKQQNTNGSTAKSKGGSKVYFKEENVENLSWNGDVSWNGETSFEDPEINSADSSPKPNQYSNSFLNFLSNN